MNAVSGGKREKTFFCAHTPAEVRPSERDEAEETETASRRGDKDESSRPINRIRGLDTTVYCTALHYYYNQISGKVVSIVTSYNHSGGTPASWRWFR